ncbi:uncharacterized protein LOC115724547 [Cannabis sativa]|uniref:Uncharacterized protein n=1 Tax=Cannabis sativa TaxID=3483 RepID=A0A803Q7E6_CANSA|nr:uncharacterized protein LOC115724547 [Cannabis sativa]XP_030509709.1 uncharacterized protein LOC115724547 [Cannabis sativa]
METLEPTTPSPSSKAVNIDSRSPASTPSSLAPSVSRLWRPAAIRNLRNQWSKLSSLRKEWNSFSSNGRSLATSLVNAYLSEKFMPSMELGALSDIPDIRKSASWKLFKQQELYKNKLLTSYKKLVAVVTQMSKASKSMRCYLKGTSNASLVEFSSSSEDINDSGDGGGIPVFAFRSVSCFEKLSEELVQMFILELNLKRFLVVELLSLSCEASNVKRFNWSDELYQGEFDDLKVCNLFSEETSGPVQPRLAVSKSDVSNSGRNRQLNENTMEVYLTTWLAEVNICSMRVDGIFAEIGEEMGVNNL